MDQTEGPEERFSALEHCLKELASDQRQLVERYYRKQEAIKDIAQSLNRRGERRCREFASDPPSTRKRIRRTMT